MFRGILLLIGVFLLSPKGFAGVRPFPERDVLERWKSLAEARLERLMHLPPPDTLHQFDVIDYELHLTVDVEGDSIWASNRVIFSSFSDTLSHLKLHLAGLTVDSVVSSAGLLSFERPDTSLIIDLGESLPEGDTDTVVIYYHGVPESGGGVFGGGLTIGDDLIYADNEPCGAKRWFPCYDNPGDKATMTQSITIPAGFRVVANGLPVDSLLAGDWWEFTWRESYPIATYLVVFAASPEFITLVDTFEYGGHVMPILTYVPHSDSLLALEKFAHLNDMIAYFSDTFGLYPFIEEKYGHVDAPIGGAMENQTNTFINMSAGWGDDWDWVVAHELSHQWWGDCVTLGDWRDIWLNEGFAVYCEALYMEHRDGVEAYHEYMDYVMYFALLYEPYPPYAIYDPQNLFSFGVTYEKGGSVHHMLRHVVGDTAYFKIMKAYLTTYAYSDAVIPDFIEIAENVSGRDLGWFFDEWIYKPGHPEYQFYWNTDSLGNDSFVVNLHVDQVQSHAYGVPTYKMPIDIGIVWEGDTLIYVVWDSLDSQDFVFRLGYRPDDLLFDPGNWIFKEVQELGAGEGSGTRRPLARMKVESPSRLPLTISLDIPSGAVLSIYDGKGALLWKRFLRGGDETLMWNGQNLSRRTIGSGVYFIDIRGKDFRLKRKLLIVR